MPQRSQGQLPRLSHAARRRTQLDGASARQREKRRGNELGTGVPGRALLEEKKTMDYYELQRNWTRKIVPHLNDEALNNILVRDFNKYSLAM